LGLKLVLSTQVYRRIHEKTLFTLADKVYDSGYAVGLSGELPNFKIEEAM
jgi:hypothetical protein